MQRRIACLAVIAIAFLAVPTALRAEDAAEHVARAKAHLEKRAYDKAIAECDRAIELDFASAEAYSTRTAPGWARPPARTRIMPVQRG